MNAEIWKPVLGYEAIYEVSNLGRVRSLNSKQKGNNKVLSKSTSTKRSKTRNYTRSYYTLSKEGKIKRIFAHRLVYEAFYGKIPEGLQIDHIDNNPENNALSNLQLLTINDNLKKRFEDNPNLVIGLPKKAVLCVETNVIYPSLHEASKRTGINRLTIRLCCEGKGKTAGGFHWKYHKEAATIN